MDTGLLKGKKVLIVDDEPDVIDTIVDLLDKCQVESASDFASARTLLARHRYDFAILDIMGVNGFGLLDIAVANGTPALVLTAHALSADNFKKSIRAGAYAYIPKDEMIDIPEYLAQMLTAAGNKKSGGWFTRLLPSFDRLFGNNWQAADKPFWDGFDETFSSTSEELRRVL